MDNPMYFYEPRQGHGLAHDPFNSIIAPRPIGWISTRNASGIMNLAPYSFFNAFNYDPPIIGFASGGRKDTLCNIEQTGEFCYNLVTRHLASAMNQTSATVAPEVDEFALARLTAVASRVVTAPRVAESPVSFECKVTQVVQLRDCLNSSIPTWLVMGEVVGVHIDRILLVNGTYDTVRADPVVRGGGPGDYYHICAEQRFQMQRPM